MNCRVCLKNSQDYTDIFSEKGKQLQILDLLEKHLWLKLNSNDKISTYICNDCWLQLYNFHEFFVLVEQSQQKLVAQNDVDFFLNGTLETACITDTLEIEKNEINNYDNEPRRSRRLHLRTSSEKFQFIEFPTEATSSTDLEENIPDKIHENEITEKNPQKIIRFHIEDSDTIISQNLALICDVCQEQQSTFNELCKHMSISHSLRGFAKCCGKKFFKRVTLLEHIEKHNNPDFFKCKECDKKFSDRQCLRTHELLKHLADEEKQYSCDKCLKRFAKPYFLEQHRVIHDDRRHICNYCQKAFPSPNLLTAHIKHMHKNTGRMCDICAKVFRGRAAFESHLIEHQGIILPKVQCPKCGFWYKNKYSLQKHIRRHNDDGVLHVCNICGKQAPNRSALLSHKRYVHTEERAFQCKICNKCFKKSLNLKEHMSTHTGEVLYKCSHCPKTFNSNGNMHTHRKRMHPNEFKEARLQRQEKITQQIINE